MDTGGPWITQYSSPKSLAFIYHTGIEAPFSVTTDSAGNVYEADGGGYVNEYPQKQNALKKQCVVTASSVAGVAVDGKAHVFVSFNGTSRGYIGEFTDFASCTGKNFAVTLGTVGGLVLDNSNNIIVCDASNAAVDVIKPPYSKISGKLGSGYVEPAHVTVNANNNRVYVADYGAHVVDVLEYPSGKLVSTISKGIKDPFGAVNGGNFVP